ncbi:hypothetical protein ETB97_009424 [Aspergillus alliaceus]|uniref:Major facilitator superfamily (MFS) profile domain-containing protein n=1 Tax=Petromyces alliaceus TaxID=209559 RepID=A0A8H6E8U5_PETAA|nr:hypothetical protein ETB97_009424 [Aspergillus burnettii]
MLLMSIFVGMFLVSLDHLIISTAIPHITDEFNSAGDIGWYGTAYLLTNCAFQLVFGKIYTVFSIKTNFLTSILLFEIGSALCGAAPNSVAFIFGRTIPGLGSGGILSGVIWKPQQATLPPRLFIQRSIASGFWVSSCLGAHINLFGAQHGCADVAIGASLMFFGQQLFGAIFTFVDRNVLFNQLARRLASIPGINSRLVQSWAYYGLTFCLGSRWYGVAPWKKNLPSKKPDGELASEEGKGKGFLGEEKSLESVMMNASTLATVEKTKQRAGKVEGKETAT